jgi:hypothetical protein
VSGEKRCASPSLFAVVDARQAGDDRQQEWRAADLRAAARTTGQQGWSEQPPPQLHRCSNIPRPLAPVTSYAWARTGGRLDHAGDVLVAQLISSSPVERGSAASFSVFAAWRFRSGPGGGVTFLRLRGLGALKVRGRVLRSPRSRCCGDQCESTFGEDVEAEVAASSGPFVGLFGEDRTDLRMIVPVRENADRVGAATDLWVPGRSFGLFSLSGPRGRWGTR